MSDVPRDPRDEALDARVRDLPRSIEPPRDLWPGIERRLPPRRRGLPAWLPIAAVLALAVLGAALWRRAARDVPAPPVVASVDPAHGAETELLAALDGPASTLSPATRETLRRNLAVIDTALAESRRALAQDPGNGDMQALVRLAQRQRLDLLRQAARLPRT